MNKNRLRIEKKQTKPDGCRSNFQGDVKLIYNKVLKVKRCWGNALRSYWQKPGGAESEPSPAGCEFNLREMECPSRDLMDKSPSLKLCVGELETGDVAGLVRVAPLSPLAPCGVGPRQIPRDRVAISPRRDKLSIEINPVSWMRETRSGHGSVVFHKLRMAGVPTFL